MRVVLSNTPALAANLDVAFLDSAQWAANQYKVGILLILPGQQVHLFFHAPQNSERPAGFLGL